MLDINKIVNDKVKSILESGDIEKSIEDAVETSVKKALTDKFECYTFTRELEKKFSTFVDPVLSELDFSSYAGIVKSRMLSVINSVLDKNIADQVESLEKSLFKINNDPIKVTSILDEFKEECRDDDCCSQDDFDLDIEVEDSGDSFKYVIVNFSKEREEKKLFSSYSTTKTYENSIRLMKYKEEPYTISWVTLEGDRYSTGDSIKRIAHLSQHQRTILNAFFSNRVIDVDIEDAGDFDTSFYEY